MSNRLVLSIAVATVLGAVAPVISASDVINACVGKTGALRVISAGDLCGRNETSLSLNTQGPRGKQGVAGPQGPVGPQGPAGPSGPGHAVAVDGDGNVIGTVLGKVQPIVYESNGRPGIWHVTVLTAEGYVAEFAQDSGRLISTVGTIYYSEPGCTGQAYAEAAPGSVGYSLSVGRWGSLEGGPVYAIPVDAASADGVRYSSVNTLTNSGGTLTCPDSNQDGTLGPFAFEAVPNNPSVTGVPNGEWVYGSPEKASSVPYPITIQH